MTFDIWLKEVRKEHAIRVHDENIMLARNALQPSPVLLNTIPAWFSKLVDRYQRRHRREDECPWQELDSKSDQLPCPQNHGHCEWQYYGTTWLPRDDRLHECLVNEPYGSFQIESSTEIARQLGCHVEYYLISYRDPGNCTRIVYWPPYIEPAPFDCWSSVERQIPKWRVYKNPSALAKGSWERLRVTEPLAMTRLWVQEKYDVLPRKCRLI